MVEPRGSPLVVEDVRKGWYHKPEPYRQAFMAWMRSEGMDPNETRRVEVHLMDTPFAVATVYVRDEQGQKMIDRQREEFVLGEEMVLLSSLPPADDTCRE